MTNNSLLRYQNLFNNIQNWPLYFKKKAKKKFEIAHFKTKGNTQTFIVPSVPLYLVFKEIFVTDFYSINQLVKKLPLTPVVIDIGANAGFFSIMLFSKIKDAVVYAYEPVPFNYELFEKNILLNPNLQKKILLFNKAVTGGSQEHVELFMDGTNDNFVVASVYEDFDIQNKSVLKVPAISLQQIVSENNLTYIDLIKIDCEGSEYPIIYEAPNELWRFINMLIIEVHNLDDDKRNVTFLSKFLQENNYNVNTEFAHCNCYKITAIKNN